MRLRRIIVYSFLLIAAAGYFKTVSASTNSLDIFLAKLQKVFENQRAIDAKLQNIEVVMKQIKVRVYRKTGFYH